MGVLRKHARSAIKAAICCFGRQQNKPASSQHVPIVTTGDILQVLDVTNSDKKRCMTFMHTNAPGWPCVKQLLVLETCSCCFVRHDYMTVSGLVMSFTNTLPSKVRVAPNTFSSGWSSLLLGLCLRKLHSLKRQPTSALM